MPAGCLTDSIPEIEDIWKKVEVCLWSPMQADATDLTDLSQISSEKGVKSAPALPSINNEVNYLLLTLKDPVSKWICGSSIPVDNTYHGDSLTPLAKAVAKQIFKICCDYGFPDMDFIDFPQTLFMAVKSEIRDLEERLVGNDPSHNPEDSINLVLNNDYHGADQTDHDVFKQQVETLLVRDDWLDHLTAWLFYQRTRSSTGNPESQLSPFEVMFQRQMLPNFGHAGCARRRLLKSSMLVCRHCHLTFTSRVSFELHQKRHLESARRYGRHQSEADKDNDVDLVVEGKESDAKIKDDEKDTDFTMESVLKQKRKTKGMKRKLLKEKRLQNVEEKLNKDKLNQFLKSCPEEDLVKSLQSLISATNFEWKRRGKYMTLSRELKDQIGKFALENGYQAAVSKYQPMLGCQLSLSTVKGLARLAHIYPPEIKRQIVDFADEEGIDAAVEHFSKILGHQVRRGTVKRFSQEVVRRGLDVSARIASRILESKEAIDFQNPRLQNQLVAKSSRFGRQQPQQHSGANAHCANDSAAATTNHNPFNETKMVTQPKIEVVKDVGDEFSSEQPLSLSINKEPGQPRFDGERLAVSLTCKGHSPGPIALTVGDAAVSVVGVEANPAGRHFDGGNSSQGENLVKTPRTTLSDNEPNFGHPNIRLSSRQCKNDKLPKKPKCQRGKYLVYPPELRMRIGKFAASHGNTAAARHFESELGHLLPESSVRGMRDKYLVMKRNKKCDSEEDDTSCFLSSTRGRPTALGPYDKVLIETLTRLRDKGEKMTSFVVIATAKQIISQVEDFDLENELDTRLTLSWAMSILRRVGKRSKKDGSS